MATLVATSMSSDASMVFPTEDGFGSRTRQRRKEQSLAGLRALWANSPWRFESSSAHRDEKPRSGGVSSFRDELPAEVGRKFVATPYGNWGTRCAPLVLQGAAVSVQYDAVRKKYVVR